MLSLFNRQTFAAFPRQSTVALFSTSSFNLLKQVSKVSATSTETKKPKKEKSPVKKPTSAYSYFIKEAWSTRKDELSKLSGFTEKSKHINQLWKNLSTSEKEKFSKLFEKDLSRYNTEIAVYKAGLPPKRPLNSYMRYFQENLSEIQQNNPTLSVIDISKLLAEKWKAMSESQKQTYKESFHKEMDQWKKQQSETSEQSL